jgi:hypothetical protein
MPSVIEQQQRQRQRQQQQFKAPNKDLTFVVAKVNYNNNAAQEKRLNSKAITAGSNV